MNSARMRSGLLATAALGAVVLSGCDSIEDVRSEPATDLPTEKVVLQGTVSGLGSRRPVELQNNGDAATARQYFGTVGATTSPFSFGAVDVGSAYNITVLTQPYGKQCTVTNGSGTASSSMLPLVVNCVNDPAIPRLNLTVNTAAMASLPNARVTLTTEEGTQEIDASGQSSVTFPGALFNSLFSLPIFQYRVTATTDTTVDGVTTRNFCTFTPVTGAFTMGGENLDATLQPVVPQANTTVTVAACSFTPTVSVNYVAPPGGTAQAMPAGGMTLALRNHVTGTVDPAHQLTVSAYGTTALSFPTPLRSNANALYELIVQTPPTGHACVVSGTVTAFSTVVTGTGATLTAPTGNAVMLIDPAEPQWWAFANRVVRCRATPVTANRLTGTYQIDRGAPFGTVTNPGRPREFLTFFADGTFMYGINFSGVRHSTTNDAGAVYNPLLASAAGLNNNTASGVTHGFYAYNPTTGTIDFTVYTATNITGSSESGALFGLNRQPGYTTAAGVGSIRATNVVKTPGEEGKLSLTFSATSGTPAVTTTRVWNLTEPDSIPGELTGTWVTADNLRVFAYNKNETYAFHMGLNGQPNVQDLCFVVDEFSTQSGGRFGRRSGGTGNCNIGGNGAAAIRDIPTANVTGAARTFPRVIPSFTGKFPNSGAQFDGRPTSPNEFSVTAGAPDSLSVQPTVNGVLVGTPLVLRRERAN